jgi:hypothetical protein
MWRYYEMGSRATVNNANGKISARKPEDATCDPKFQPTIIFLSRIRKI